MSPKLCWRPSSRRARSARRRSPEGTVTGAAHRAPKPPALTALVGQLLGRGGGRGLDTSGGLLFNNSLWARDRVITALDLIDHAPQAGVETVLALAALQGTRHRVLSEEGPGRIHSEHRDLRAWQAPLWLKALFGLAISTIWGGTPLGYTTYFSSDSTPLFILLVAALAQREPSILDETVVRKDGRPATVLDSVIEACGWIEEHLSPDGLVEVGRSNPLALQQVWKDAPTSNFDERGRMPNVLRPMAYLDVQALAAEALGAVERRLDARHQLLRRSAHGAASGARRRHRAHAVLRRAAHGGRHSWSRLSRPQSALSQLPRERLAGRHGDDRPRVASPGP
jgi:glycogen debranching enzyme